MFMSLFVIYGFDTASTLAEETRDPRRAAPKAVLFSVIGAFIIGGVFLLGTLVAIPNLHTAITNGAGARRTSSRPTSRTRSPRSTCWSSPPRSSSAACRSWPRRSGCASAWPATTSCRSPGRCRRVSPSLHTPVWTCVTIAVLAAIPFLQYSGAATIAIAATGMIYLSYFLGNIVIMRARLRGWPKTRAPFRLGGWGIRRQRPRPAVRRRDADQLRLAASDSNPEPNQTVPPAQLGLPYRLPEQHPDPVVGGVFIVLIGALYYLFVGRAKAFAPVVAPAADDPPLGGRGGSPGGTADRASQPAPGRLLGWPRQAGAAPRPGQWPRPQGGDEARLAETRANAAGRCRRALGYACPRRRPRSSAAPGTTVHAQIEDWLAGAIAVGQLAPGDRLPTEHDLAAWLGVSRMTLRHALGELAQRGLVTRAVGRNGGTFVAEPKLEQDLTTLAGFSEQLRRHGMVAGRAGADRGRGSRPARPPRRRSSSPTAIRCTRFAGSGWPTAGRSLWSTRCFPRSLFPDLLQCRLDGSLYELLEDRYGQRPHRARETPRAGHRRRPGGRGAGSGGGRAAHAGRAHRVRQGRASRLNSPATCSAATGPASSSGPPS